ncbi:hypothetical protein E2I00_000229 [Balaenoptera physalus]|uniref:Uncharacterized protein n=1 Tax=Balaenoptera physalus TaxID=9770 RepID=A0A643CD83_BALPH|nr:hypothetical protein E2I00_000229 [Balaenoptera physalus]
MESFARRTYSVSFPMFSKIAVIGTGAHPAFKYLTQTSGKEPTGNLCKYLVAPVGKVVGRLGPNPVGGGDRVPDYSACEEAHPEEARRLIITFPPLPLSPPPAVHT